VSNSSARLLPCAIVLLLAVMLAACAPNGTTTTGSSKPSTAVTGVATPTTQSTTTPTTGTPGSAPASLPSDIPAYPGAQLLKSGTEGSMTVYFFTSQDSFEQVMAFYQQQMPKYGWRERPVPTPTADPLGDYVKGQRHALIESRTPSPPASAHGSGPTTFSITVSG
jgi:hypothetical protein